MLKVDGQKLYTFEEMVDVLTCYKQLRIVEDHTTKGVCTLSGEKYVPGDTMIFYVDIAPVQGGPGIIDMTVVSAKAHIMRERSREGGWLWANAGNTEDSVPSVLWTVFKSREDADSRGMAAVWDAQRETEVACT